jgi:hypothetical protein
MTTELDSVAPDAPDNAEAAKLRTARKAINVAHGSGNITDEQHAEAIRKLLMNGTALAASPASQAERPREGWLRRLLFGFGFLFLLTVGVIAIVSLLVHFLPAQGPASAWKYAVQQNYGMKSQDRAGPVVL